jgi:hypothetical protein
MSSDERPSEKTPLHEKSLDEAPTHAGAPDQVRGGRGRSGIYGLIAGAVFLVASMLLAALAGSSPVLPLRMMASVVLGVHAMTDTSLGVTLVMGGLAHALLSAFYGLIYGALREKLSPESRASAPRQAALGLLFGLAVYLVDLQLIARFVYPWLLAFPQAALLLLHAVTFGLPLSLLFAAAERRVVRPEVRASPRVPVRRPS